MPRVGTAALDTPRAGRSSPTRHPVAGPWPASAGGRRRGGEPVGTTWSRISRRSPIRAARTDTVVCVVGEFKKGKSALINALLGTPVCPVDDDFATMAVTVVSYADQPGASVRRREDGELVIEAIPADEIGTGSPSAVDADRRRASSWSRSGCPNRSWRAASRWSTRPGVGGLTPAMPPRPWPSCPRPTRSSS